MRPPGDTDEPEEHDHEGRAAEQSECTSLKGAVVLLPPTPGAPLLRPSELFGTPPAPAGGTRTGGAPLDEEAISKIQALMFTSLSVREEGAALPWVQPSWEGWGRDKVGTDALLCARREVLSGGPSFRTRGGAGLPLRARSLVRLTLSTRFRIRERGPTRG